jgi:hypothetical protein
MRCELTSCAARHTSEACMYSRRAVRWRMLASRSGSRTGCQPRFVQAVRGIHQAL